MSSWLVTGGAGYIGAHVVKAFRDLGEPVVVVDDLSTGEASRVGDAPLVVGSVADRELLTDTLRTHAVDGIVHIAAKKQVGESVADPLRYYRENVGGLISLLEAAADCGVGSFVFSSSSSVYGMPDVELVTEEVRGIPLSPYGETKLIGEWMTRAIATATDLQVISLRYFNAAGAACVELGDPGVFNLIPLALRALTGGTPPTIFGDDYPTPDGTCIRDYVHVADIADAHVAAVRHLSGGGRSSAYNVGRGQGSSVREILAEVAAVTGIDIPATIAARRPGDPARVTASVEAIHRDLGWQARYDLREIVQSAWEAWQHRPPG
ncbi:MAG TPA: UDP-glucose 4-epimerase GalE [Mycobacteriales bacterium]|nr:UDP-glucose 4-epimerase GalE [Mycobacteriales bacterium]